MVAEVGGIELCVFVNLTREEACPERAEWHEADAKLIKRRKQLRFRATPEQRVFTLHRRDWLNRMCTADRLNTGLRKAKVLHLTLCNQFLDCSGHVFDGD